MQLASDSASKDEVLVDRALVDTFQKKGDLDESLDASSFEDHRRIASVDLRKDLVRC